MTDAPFNSRNQPVTREVVAAFLEAGGVRRTGYALGIFRQAFVHRSYCLRKSDSFEEGNVVCPPGCEPLQSDSNERLEFLGDAVLNFVVADYTYERYPRENEGFLTKLRTKLVNGKMLARLSAAIGLGSAVLLSRQIEENNGRRNSNVLEDTFEAFVGAIYLTFGDYAVARQWITGVLERNINFAELIQSNNHFKDSFIKHYQQLHGVVPRFLEVNVQDRGHCGKEYTYCLKDPSNNTIGLGKGATKKEAENVAARCAMVRYGLLAADSDSSDGIR
jgi:ribonuclease III